MLLFHGCVKTDNGGFGKLLLQFNEDDGDETMADVIWCAMINEGDDCDDIDYERKRVRVLRSVTLHAFTDASRAVFPWSSAAGIVPLRLSASLALSSVHGHWLAWLLFPFG